MHEIRKFIIIKERKLQNSDIYKWEIIQAQIFLEIYYTCLNNRTLPRTGGLLDQDSFYVHLMRYADKERMIQEELEEKKRKSEIPTR